MVLAALALVAFVIGASSGASTTASGKGVGYLKLLGPIEPSQREVLDKARQAVLAHTPYVTNGSAKGNEVALTFDDGPGEFTPQVLKILNETKTPATFFMLGQNIQEYPQAAQAVAVGGYSVDDHTWDHKDLKTLDAAGQQQEIVSQTEAVTKLGIPKPVFFRPPYGSYNQTTLDVLNEQKMLMVLWSVDSEDWTLPGADAIVNNVLGPIKAGDIVLMHDAGGPRDQTVAALPRIIKGLKEKGLKPVTVGQLLADDPPPADQGQPPGLSGG
jgi:peptidoglycan-N-acetylglucosamine deacetylase